MANRGDGLRIDQSVYPGNRTPSREQERVAWFAKRQRILRLIENGATIRLLSSILEVSPTTIHHYFQRMYNEAELLPGDRTQPSLLRVAYEEAWLPCPCSRRTTMGRKGIKK